MSGLKDCVPSELNPPANVILVQDEGGLNLVKEFLDTVSVFGLDTETNMVPTFYDRRIRTIQLGDKVVQYVIDLLSFAGDSRALTDGQGSYTPGEWAKPILDVLRPALESNSHLKVGVNFQFDYEVLKWCLGLRTWNIYDCYLAEKVLHAGKVHFMMKGFWAMDDMVARYCGLKISKAEQKGFDLETPLTEAQVIYAGLDVRFPLAIKKGQEKRIAEYKLEKTVQIENNCICATGDRHLAGILCDAEKWTSEVNLVKAEYQRRLEVLDNLFLPIVGNKELDGTDLLSLEQAWKNTEDKEERKVARAAFYAARRKAKEVADNYTTYEGQSAINFGSVGQLKSKLNEAGYALKDTDDKSLAKYEGDPLIDALRAFRAVQKTRSMYEPFLESFVDKNTGRIHPNFNQLGAATGRESCLKPNMLNIDKESNWRSCFVARSGKVLITIDYDGQELRIIAENSGEPAWIDAFNKGWDVHSVCAEMLFGQRWKDAAEEGCAYYAAHKKCSCKGHKKLRNDVKAVSFGLCIAEGQRVLTDQGLVEIQNVTTAMKVWDGVEWVSHQGLIYQGEKEVITYDGLTATPDHKVWLENKKRVSLREAQSDVERPRLAVTGIEETPIRFSDDSIRTFTHSSTLGQSCLCKMQQMFKNFRNMGAESTFWSNNKLQSLSLSKIRLGYQGTYSWGSLRRYATTLYESTRQQLEELWGTRNRESFQVSGRLHSVHSGISAAQGLQGGSNRSDRQRWALREEQYQAGNSSSESYEPKKKVCKVYDLYCAGPRHRFTCEGKLVSNCYGAMASNIAEQLAITKDEAQVLLDEYFATFSKVAAYLDKSGKYSVANLLSRTNSGRIRFYPKPTQELAKKYAAEAAAKKGKVPSQRDEAFSYKSMYESIERKGKNSPIQGGGADTIKTAIGCGFDPNGKPYLWHDLELKYGAQIINVVYDEIVVEADESNAEEVMAFVEDGMARAGAEFVKSVVMEAEGCIAKHWKKG